MVKGWIKLIVVLLTGLFSVGFPVAKGISWGAPQPYLWWVFGFHLGLFGISVLLGALACSRSKHRFWWFFAYIGAYFGIAFGAMKLNELVTSSNGWPYGGDMILPVMCGFLVCGQLWRPDYIKPTVRPITVPIPSQPKV